MLRWFETRLEPYPADAPTEPPRGLLAFSLHYIRGAKRWLALMAVFTALIALSEVMLFGLMGNVVDWLSSANRETFLQDEGAKLWLMGAFVLIVLPLVIATQSFVIHQTLLGNVPQRIRWWMHRYVINQSMTYFQDEFAGRIAAKLMQTSLAIREVVMKLLDVLNYVVVYFIGAVVLAAMNDWRLAIPFLVWLAAYAMVLRYFIPRMGKISELQADARSTMTGRIVDGYTNIATVKLFSHSMREETYAREAMEEFLSTVHTQMRMVTVLNIAIYTLNVLLLASIFAVGISLWLHNAITPGAIAAAAALVLRFFGMSQWIMWEMSALFENIGTVRDGMTSIAVPRLVPDKADAKPLVVSKGEVDFTDVGFHYGKGKGIIEGFNLTIKPGEKVGLVGRSGAGKSTLINLLLRFYDLETGTVRIDGQNIASIKQDSLRAAIGVVSQDTSLLHRSVRENLTYGRPDATDEQMIAAAKSAEAHEFILGLSDKFGRTGYDAYVGERGVKLSGGQRQRIAIARVLLKNAPILVLDEATSALDSEVEAAIQTQLHHLMDGKSVIAIAHRLSTIAAMDRLIVLDKGHIVEEGTHAELIARNGIYAQLWHRQSGGFIAADDDSEAAE